MKLHDFPWPYFTLIDGVICEDGRRAFNNQSQKFQTIEQAEQWLIDNDERGTVTSVIKTIKHEAPE